MKPAEFRGSVSKTPFKPFRLRLKDGRVADVVNADDWCISPSGGSIVVLTGQANPYINVTAGDVESVEPFDPDLEADLAAARAAIARLKSREKPIPWEQVKRELGLDDDPPDWGYRRKMHQSNEPLPDPKMVYRFSVAQYELMTEYGILTKHDRVELIEGIVTFKGGYLLDE